MAKQVTLEAAERVIDACRKKAEEVGVPLCVAVDDGGGQPGRVRPHGRGPARRGRGRREQGPHRRPVPDVHRRPDPAGAAGGPAIRHPGGRRRKLVVFGGGVPLTGEDGRVVGAVGVSGGSPEQDQDVAAAGAAAF